MSYRGINCTEHATRDLLYAIWDICHVSIYLASLRAADIGVRPVERGPSLSSLGALDENVATHTMNLHPFRPGRRSRYSFYEQCRSNPSSCTPQCPAGLHTKGPREELFQVQYRQ